MGESVIPKKYREMMMLASAAATKCCQTYHKEVAKTFGATEEELNELAMVAAQVHFGVMSCMYRTMIMSLL